MKRCACYEVNVMITVMLKIKVSVVRVMINQPMGLTAAAGKGKAQTSAIRRMRYKATSLTTLIFRTILSSHYFDYIEKAIPSTQVMQSRYAAIKGKVSMKITIAEKIKRRIRKAIGCKIYALRGWSILSPLNKVW